MEIQQKKSRVKNWIYFTVWFAALAFMLMTPSVRQYFWLALPGTATQFALGMDLI